MVNIVPIVLIMCTHWPKRLMKLKTVRLLNWLNFLKTPNSKPSKFISAAIVVVALSLLLNKARILFWLSPSLRVRHKPQILITNLDLVALQSVLIVVAETNHLGYPIYDIMDQKIQALWVWVASVDYQGMQAAFEMVHVWSCWIYKGVIWTANWRALYLFQLLRP